MHHINTSYIEVVVLKHYFGRSRSYLALAMLNNDHYSTQVESDTSAAIALSECQAAVESFSAAVATSDPATNRDLRQFLHETGLVNPIYEWLTNRPSDPTELQSAPNIVFLGLDNRSDLAFAHSLKKACSGVRIVACSDQTSPEFLLEAIRVGICDFLHKPIDRAEVRSTLTRIVREKTIPAQTPTAKLFVVMGTKGGVGTSTIAVNLGVQMAQIPGKRAILLDFSRPLGDVSLLLDLRPRFRLWDAVENADRLDPRMLGDLLTQHESGLQVLPGATHPDEWQQIPVSSLARVSNVALAHFDYVIIDLGSMYSTDWKSILSSAEILLVAEADVPGLAKLERHLSVLSRFEIPYGKIRIVANRWHPQDDEALAAIEKNLKSSIFARLPNDFHRVREANTLGVPLAQKQCNPLTIAFRKLAFRLAGGAPDAEERSAKSKFSSLLHRVRMALRLAPYLPKESVACRR